MIIDGMMHLEVSGAYWEGLIDEVVEHYDAAGIDRGVVLTTWTPSQESNDRTRQACARYPDRFVPFAHVRPVDDWQSELQRVTQEFGWAGLKLHQGELQEGGPDMMATTRAIAEKAVDLGIRWIKIHLVDYDMVEELTRELSEAIWILPHMGCWGRWEDMQRYCELARGRANVYLDTSGVAPYYNLGKGFQWAGIGNVTFATDGHQFSPLVEIAKIRALQLPTPFQTPRLTDEELDMILGGTMAELLGL